MMFDFERGLQFVDSETVLNMINNTSTRFKVYGGVRVGEIQAASDGYMSGWARISGHNTADWFTRGRAPEELKTTQIGGSVFLFCTSLLKSGD